MPNLLQCFTTLGSRDDISDKIQQIAVPTLVVHGDTDNAIALPRAQAMAQAIPNAQLAVIAGAGHAANLTHPEAVNPVLEAFLATLA